MNQIRIQSMAVSHPEQSIGNDFYLEHFKKLHNADYSDFLQKVLGRERRYITSEKENTLTMAIDASLKVLKKAQIDVNEIDMILFSSQVPEYILPTNSVLIHRAIGAGHHTGVLDTNANCSGMLIAFDYACRFLMSHSHMKKILLVGSDNLSILANPNDSITYPNFGDAAVAMILEKVEGENCGLIDSMYFTESSNFDRVTYPKDGLSQGKKSGSMDYMQWLPFDGDVSIENAKKMMDELMARNDLKADDIQAFCLSQFSIFNINKLQAHFNVEKEKMIYVGDEFGYTGTTSPLIALNKAIESGQVKRGDKVLLWTVGIGYHLIAILYQY